MKTSFLLVPLGAILLSVTNHKVIHRNATIEFQGEQTGISVQVSDQLESVYEHLPDGYRVELRLVDPALIRNDYNKACQLAWLRLQSVVTFLGGMGVEPYDIHVHQYRKHILAQTITLEDASQFDRRYLSTLSFTKDPKRPLMFTSTDISPFKGNSNCYQEELDNSKPKTIYHPSGAEITIPPYAFQYRGGHSLNCPRIVIQICYYRDRHDFVAANLSTNSGKRMLESGGMMHISATCFGYDIELRNGIELEIFMPAPNRNDEMQLFLGRDQYGITNWNRAREGGIVNGLNDIGDDLSEEEMEGITEEGFLASELYSEEDGYLVETNQLGWINCDYFYDIDRPTELAVTLGEQKRNIAVRMVFESINSVMPGYYYDSDSLVKFDQIPPGESVKVIAYGKVGDGYVWDVQSITTGQQSAIKLNPTVVSKAVLEEQIAGL